MHLRNIIIYTQWLVIEILHYTMPVVFFCHKLKTVNEIIRRAGSLRLWNIYPQWAYISRVKCLKYCFVCKSVANN